MLEQRRRAMGLPTVRPTSKLHLKDTQINPQLDGRQTLIRLHPTRRHLLGIIIPIAPNIVKVCTHDFYPGQYIVHRSRLQISVMPVIL